MNNNIEPSYDDDQQEVDKKKTADQSVQPMKQLKAKVKSPLFARVTLSLALAIAVMSLVFYVTNRGNSQSGFYRIIEQRGDTFVGRHRLTPDAAKKINCYKLTYNNKKLKTIETFRVGKLHDSLPYSMVAKIVVEDIQNGKKHINKDINNKPATDLRGGHYYTLVKKEENVIVSTRYGLFGAITGGYLDIAQIEATLDKKGRLLKSLAYDGRLVQIKNKQNELYETRYRYDNDSNLIELAMYNLVNKPANDKYGVAIYRHKYDKYGIPLEISCHGTDGELKDSDLSGVAITRMKYDDLYNLIEIGTYGINEQLRNNKEGYAIIRFKYNEKRDCIKTSHYDADEKPVENKDGIAVYLSKYDEAGNTLEKSGYGVKGTLKEDASGVAIYKQLRDTKGDLIEVSFFGANNKLKENNDGIAIVRFKYDEKGNAIETSQYNVNDVLREDKSGVAVKEFKYDEAGNLVRYAQYDANRQLKGDVTGIAIREMKYDTNRNMIELRTYGADQQLKEDIAGVAVLYKKYDTNNNIVESKILNKFEQLISDAYGIAIRRYKYDENNSKIEESLYGLDDNLKEDKSGIAVYRYKYDGKGNIIESKLYGADYEPKNNKEGFSVYRAKYDDLGKAVEEKYYDVNDTPVEGPQNYIADRLKRNVASLLAENEKQACIANLKQIQGAIQVWAIDTGASSTAMPRISDIVGNYLKQWPECRGVPYKISFVGDTPRCPNGIPGHTIE